VAIINYKMKKLITTSLLRQQKAGYRTLFH
jgi:hypothetical protein